MFVKNCQQIQLIQICKNLFSQNQKVQKQVQQTKIKYDYLYGINPIQAALYSNSRDKFFEIYVHENQQNNTNPRVANIINKANSLDINVKFLNQRKMDHFCSKIKHYNQSKTQNIVLKCLPRSYQKINIDDFENQVEKQQFNVCLQGITDPQNLGAIIRSCYYLGVDKLIVENKPKAPLSAAVSKSSAGAMELIDIYEIKNLSSFLKQLQEEKQYDIISTGSFDSNHNDSEQNNKKKMEISDLNINSNKNGVTLVFGSEGEGVSQEILDLSNYIVGIQQQYSNKNISIVDSLNVNAAAAIFIQNIKNKINKSK